MPLPTGMHNLKDGVYDGGGGGSSGIVMMIMIIFSYITVLCIYTYDNYE